ncbi:hypothetical protein ACU4GD_26715 [Cupriavidus basilensis]
MRSPYQQIEIGENATQPDLPPRWPRPCAPKRMPLSSIDDGCTHGRGSWLGTFGASSRRRRRRLGVNCPCHSCARWWCELDPEFVTLARPGSMASTRARFDDPRVHLAIGDAPSGLDGSLRPCRRRQVRPDRVRPCGGRRWQARRRPSSQPTARKPPGAASRRAARCPCNSARRSTAPTRFACSAQGCASVSPRSSPSAPLSRCTVHHGPSRWPATHWTCVGTGTALLSERLRAWKLEQTLRCYHAALHPALFTLPRHLQALFDSAGAPA